MLRQKPAQGDVTTIQRGENANPDKEIVGQRNPVRKFTDHIAHVIDNQVVPVGQIIDRGGAIKSIFTLNNPVGETAMEEEDKKKLRGTEEVGLTDRCAFLVDLDGTLPLL